MNAYAKMAQTTTSQHRRSLIAKVHVAKKTLGLADDDYRAVLLRVVGHDSAAMLREDQLLAVVQEFERLGFSAAARTPRPGPKRADHPVALKARAIWISLYQLGEIEDASEPALEAFARRQLKVERLQWADQAMGYKLIEALKAMATRAGWDQRLDGIPVHAKLVVLKRRLVLALLDRMRGGLIPADWTIERAAFQLAGIQTTSIVLLDDVQQLDLIARSFAAKLRDFRAAGGES